MMPKLKTTVVYAWGAVINGKLNRHWIYHHKKDLLFEIKHIKSVRDCRIVKVRIEEIK